jgi:hypothetical protein
MWGPPRLDICGIVDMDPLLLICFLLGDVYASYTCLNFLMGDAYFCEYNSDWNDAYLNFFWEMQIFVSIFQLEDIVYNMHELEFELIFLFVYI